MAHRWNGLGNDDLRLLENAKEFEAKLPVGWPNVSQVWAGAEPPPLRSELPKRSFKWGALVDSRAPAIQHGEDTGGPWPLRYARCGLECHHLAEQSTESCTSGMCGCCGGCNYRCLAHWVTVLAAELLELFEPGLTLVWFMVLMMRFLWEAFCPFFFVSGWYCFTSVRYYYFVSSLY